MLGSAPPRGSGCAGRPPSRRTGSRWRCRSLAWSSAAVSSSVKVQVGGPQVGLQLLHRPAAEDGRGDAGPVGHPGQRDLGHRDAPRLGDLLHGVDRSARCVRCRAGRTPPCPASGLSPSRVSPVGRWSRRYLPDSQPPPSGLHGSMPIPASSTAGTISHSISRTIRLYCGCRVTGAATPERRRPGARPWSAASR